MIAGIYFNKNYFSDNRENIHKIQSKLSASGVECRIIDSFGDLDGLDVLFVLGGDGTILMVAAECAARGIKIIGINYGHVGFLAEFEPEKLNEAVELVLSGNYSVQKRSMLKVECGDKCFYALNDLVIQRSTNGDNFANAVNLHAEINGTTVDNFSSDGIIVSTPTGSTAYSLSAGGSILAPELDAFILTPICAHSLHSRPVVYGDSSTLKVRPVNAKSPLVVAVDGKIAGELRDGGLVTVTKADRLAEFITAADKSFFNKLLIKLSIWSK